MKNNKKHPFINDHQNLNNNKIGKINKSQNQSNQRKR